MTMPRKSDERAWTVADRSIEPPQRRLARQMRRMPTGAEKKLWWHLRHRLSLSGSHFRRQVQIGPFVADFASHTLKIVIEVDGGQHAAEVASDQRRTERLEADGYCVLRYWNHDVLLNVDGVLEDIQRAIAATPTPNPSPQGGGER
ncbi:endonuclease domain-containing protein [Pseudorhodoplanes sp.]|uniref:endonuclease domain-containing protein n=1 Tax=Pseudorhodoplanes sp. TaxID=1934341 RepID=UPI003D0CA73A